ncbi:putative tricarboxylic transport membrane protein [Actinoplanes lutulentus]|uniref:Putative tricarboxylic transport membrane protein n=1 Tax=Actinoplanes lutulentus TaxID=1287878 RepID=A0A327ZAM3_9ACTN|nr:tripartite tricarboxylate transporter permease [Actinoplanes lutulentus]MBB2947274.1 putative tricarboxylic transport membrane protein [Actinoplanes lutulentus]RAK36549.1 putative tricarboxylic transport membrane protein [Actinoplanes lutulentus]
MSEVIDGFAVVLEPTNLLYCLVGVVIGMLIGVLPGLGPAATIAILLPLTFGLEPVTAIIMLAGIFYGAQYGGTITSVLLRLPGEASSVVTVFDGHALARQGRAGTALGIAAIGSFVGGTLAIVALTFVAPLVAEFALDFGPPEYTALALLGILLVSTISSGGRLRALTAAAIGLLLATVGRDDFTSAERFTLGNLSLADGLDFVPIAMGLFGLGEILYNLEERHRTVHAPATVANVWPSRTDLKQSGGAIGRGSVLGFFLGILPGGGAVLASLAAYALEKRRSKHPERFGNGAIEGVAAPETANNAAATSSFIPLLSLGIPANATMAVIFGALLIQGVTPGPQLITENPELFWGVVNSMYLGNILLLIMSIPLVGLFVRILRIRATVLAPITVLITLVGAYTVNNSVFDIGLVIAFGVLGYLMKKAGFDPGPMVLAFVLGSLLETSLRRSLLLFDGDPTGFVTRPISGVLLAVLIAVILLPAAQLLRRRTQAAPPATAAASLTGATQEPGPAPAAEAEAAATTPATTTTADRTIRREEPHP